jgi:AcrR family transcriptional regulator
VKPVRPYHRGNLRETLLDAAVALIAEVGPRAFTLREVARRAEVSHNAPYRHFHDRDELLAAVAAQGFERLTTAMKRSASRGETALHRLRLCGRGYVDFALRWPQHFLVMFDLPEFDRKYPEYAVAGERAFQTLVGFIVESQQSGDLPAGGPLSLAWMAWSTVHGAAKLAISGRLPLRHSRLAEFMQYVSEAMVKGMANVPNPGAER